MVPDCVKQARGNRRSRAMSVCNGVVSKTRYSINCSLREGRSVNSRLVRAGSSDSTPSTQPGSREIVPLDEVIIPSGGHSHRIVRQFRRTLAESVSLKDNQGSMRCSTLFLIFAAAAQRSEEEHTSELQSLR